MNKAEKKAEESYQPFGEEWKNELMKMPKIQIIALYRQLELENQELKTEIEKKKKINTGGEMKEEKDNIYTEIVAKAESYLANNGYGSGTNYTTNQVAWLMAFFAKRYHRQEIEEMMPVWENIDKDDFIARIGDYVLRVEQIDNYIWWCSVGIGKQILELYNETNTEEQAKRLAEGVYLKHYIKSLLKKKE